MTSIGLRDLRQSASDFVKAAEGGETFTVTVSGRPAAVLGPVAREQWRTWADVASLFHGSGSADLDWEHDRGLVDQSLRDPFDAADA